MKQKTSQLKNLGLRTTGPRFHILAAFGHDCVPLSADDIFEKVKKYKIDRATVYRTLHSFQKHDLVRRLDMRQDSVYYELKNTHHHHITCTSCGTVEKVDQCEIEGLGSRVAKKSSRFDLVSDHSLEFFGICLSCAKK